jgi:GAF domain-containing protein
MKVDYQALKKRACELFANERDAVANLANFAALLYTSLGDVNWVGFYLTRGAELVLGPFQGNPAVSRIKLGAGVFGTAAKTGTYQLVPDVCSFPGHIVCDVRSKSELVLPIMISGFCFGVLDLDSAILARFNQEDVEGLNGLLETLIENSDFVSS